MKKLDKNIIQLEPDMDMTYLDGDFDIIYLDRLHLYDIVSYIVELNSDINDSIKTLEDVFYNLVEGEEEDYLKMLKDYDYGDFMYDLEDLEELKTLQDYINEFSEVDLIEFFLDVDDDNIIEKLCTKNNCKFGTVGYNFWNYYIAYKDIEYSFIQDLYEGRNWYVISLLDEEGHVLDSVGGVYASDTRVLDSVIKDNFGLEPDSYYLIDNEHTQYFDKPKVKEYIIKHYHFEIID